MAPYEIEATNAIQPGQTPIKSDERTQLQPSLPFAADDPDGPSGSTAKNTAAIFVVRFAE